MDVKLHAPYEKEPNDSYICHRTAQAWEIAKLMRGAAERGHMVLGVGDFNMIPLSLAHRVIEAHSPVKDVWRILDPDTSIGAAVDEVERRRGVPIPGARYNITKNGATCDSPLNTWRWDKARQKRLDRGEDIEVSDDTEDPRGKRLDYIFFAPGTGIPHTTNSGSSESGQLHLDSVEVGMLFRHPTLKCTLSDHFSVEAIFKQSPAAKTANSSINYTTSILPVEVYQKILDMISVYMARERRQRRLRLSHFGGQLVVSIACLVAVWWVPANFVAFILMLVSTLGLSAGVIDGLIGGLFVGSEMRALKEFEWEIRNAMDLASSQKTKEVD
jgi:sphingomyelin phosphodiesterase 2